VRRSAPLLLLFAVLFPLQVNASKDERLTDRELYVQVAQNGAFNEYRCRGLSADATKRKMRRFKSRINEVTRAMVEKHGSESVALEEIILIGRPCPAYLGSIKRLERNLVDMEKRLGLKQ
jgi:hypothetical protein